MMGLVKRTSLRRVVPLVILIVVALFLWTKWRSTGSRSQAKVAKVTIVLNRSSASYIERALQSHDIQNKMHGYKQYIGNYELVNEAVVNPDRPVGTWTKPAYLLHILLEELNKDKKDRLEWLFWFDADTIILNPHIRLETFLPPQTSSSNTELDSDTIHLLMASNWNGINAGVFPIRVHPWSVLLLSSVLAYPHLQPGHVLEFQDQSALNFSLYNSPTFYRNFSIVPHRWFNSFPINGAYDAEGNWVYAENMTPDRFDDGGELVELGRQAYPWKVRKGDMCLHFAGAKRVLESWMTPWLDRTESYLSEWSDPVYHAQLKREVAFFWHVTEPELRQEARKLDESKKLSTGP